MNKPLRVAHLVSHPIHYFVPLYRELASRPEIDHEVFYFSDETANKFFEKDFEKEITWDVPLLEGYKANFLPTSRGRGISNNFIQIPNFDIIRKVAFGEYDVIWAHGYAHPNTWLAAVASIVCRRKFFIREEQTLLSKRPWHKRLLKNIMLRFLFSKTFGFYIGENNRRYFEHFGMPSERLFPARYCVDNDYFGGKAKEMAGKKNQIRLDFGITDDAPVILFAGKFIAKKQPLLLIEAFARLRRETPCWLLLAGDGTLRQKMEDKIRQEKIPNVLIAGFLNQSELPRAYVAADIFVLPSAYMETWGLVVNEAMNFSLPIVVTDKVGCATDLIQDGFNGFVVKNGCSVDLKNAIWKLVIDSNVRKKFGDRSHNIVSHYSIKDCADNIVAAFLKVNDNNKYKGYM